MLELVLVLVLVLVLAIAGGIVLASLVIGFLRFLVVGDGRAPSVPYRESLVYADSEAGRAYRIANRLRDAPGITLFPQPIKRSDLYEV